ncbi:MAG: hypothetical protein RL274_1418 [Pseudomonadota bacterium]|jgi:hypothetical protein
MAEFNLNRFREWPADLLRVLEKHAATFESWKKNRKNCKTSRFDKPDDEARQSALCYDQAIGEVKRELSRHHGQRFHCTKLTDFEINRISSEGMELPNLALLNRRITELETRKILPSAIAERLRMENQANNVFRKDMIWFCFFDPLLAGQDGIERFFRSWGGESLYNSHEDDPQTGAALLAIGTPCVIEAAVPLDSLKNINGLANKVGRRFLCENGHRFREPTHYEGPITSPLHRDAVKAIVTYPAKRFIALTGCSEWTSPLPN